MTPLPPVVKRRDIGLCKICKICRRKKVILCTPYPCGTEFYWILNVQVLNSQSMLAGACMMRCVVAAVRRHCVAYGVAIRSRRSRKHSRQRHGVRQPTQLGQSHTTPTRQLITPPAVGGGALSDGAIRPSVCLSVRLSVLPGSARRCATPKSPELCTDVDVPRSAGHIVSPRDNLLIQPRRYTNNATVSVRKSPEGCLPIVPGNFSGISLNVWPCNANKCIGLRTEWPKRTLAAGWVFPATIVSQRASVSGLLDFLCITGRTDGRTHTRQMLYAFSYGCCQRNKRI